MKTGMNRREFLKVAGAATVAASVTSLAPLLAESALDKGYVHFGGSLPLTSPYGKVAKMYQEAYEFYAATVNNKIMVADKEYELKLTIYDDENKPSKTAQLTEKLIVADKVDLLLSSYGTDPVLGQAAVCKRYNKILINAGAATRRVESEFGGTVFTLVPTGDYYHRTLLEMVAALNPPIKTVGIITPNDPIYHEIAGAIKEQCKTYGMEVLVEDVIPMDATDLEPTVLKMKTNKVEMVINTGWDKILASFVTKAHAHQLDLKFLDGGHVMVTPFLKDALGARLQNICGVTFFMPEAKTQDAHYGDSLNFAQKYQEKYGYEPGYHAAMAYTLLNLYELILRGAAPNDPFNSDELKKALTAVDQEMLWGRVRFNAQGRIEKDMLVIQWQGDPPNAVIVYPPQYATGTLNYPANPLSR